MSRIAHYLNFNFEIRFAAEFSKELFETLKADKSDASAGDNAESSAGNSNSVENLNQLIAKAGTMNELLAIVDKPRTTRFHALKIVSTLAEWSAAGKVKPTDFENNARFIRVCSLLTARAGNNRSIQNLRGNIAYAAVQSKELEMILNVAGEDESAKLIQSLKLSQMVKVLSAMALKRTRSLSLLRNLAYGISSSTEKLNLKECSDVYYALTILNYHDGMLMTRISMDTIANLESKDNIKAAPVGSIAKSVGLLKFKDTGALCNHILNHEFSLSCSFLFRIDRHSDQMDT